MYAFKLKKSGQSEVDIFSTWGVRLKSLPLKPPLKRKEVAVRSWAESQGDDEYLPSGNIYQAYEADVSFFYEGGIDSIATNVIGFLEYLQGGEIGFYDEYTGRKGQFRYKKMNDDAIYHQEDDAIEFTITFKFNDPTSEGGF